MDFNEGVQENGVMENGYTVMRQSNHQPGNNKTTLLWLDLRVFYVRFSKCCHSTPEYLTLNYVPLNRDTLLEVNGTRTSIYSDGVSSILKRDRLDKRSEEVTFVNTDSMRMSGSVKFEVFHKDLLLLSGTLEFCHSNGFMGESKNQWHDWSMNCESDVILSSGFFQGNQNKHSSLEASTSPAMEVYVAGCYSDSPIILSKTLQMNHRKKHGRKVTLESIPEYEATSGLVEDPSSTAIQSRNCSDYKADDEIYCSPYPGMEYFEGEDGELSWFNAGVRVGVGIGLSLCLGVGIGVGLLARSYHGTTRNLIRRMM